MSDKANNKVNICNYNDTMFLASNRKSDTHDDINQWWSKNMKENTNYDKMNVIQVFEKKEEISTLKSDKLSGIPNFKTVITFCITLDVSAIYRCLHCKKILVSWYAQGS